MSAPRQQSPLPLDPSADPNKTQTLSESNPTWVKLPPRSGGAGTLGSQENDREDVGAEERQLFDTGTLERIKQQQRKPETTDQHVQAALPSSDYQF